MLRRDHSTRAPHGEQVAALRRIRHGFTLIEVMVAIAIGGLVLLGARSLLEVLADEEHHVALDTSPENARSNGYRTLRFLVGQMEVGTTESGPFSGDPDRTSFTTWCDVPAGWQERCAVTIAFEREAEGPALVAHLPGERRLVLARDFSAGEFRYLNSATSGGQWFLQWGRGITAPLAIGVIIDRGTTSGDAPIDTLIVRIGERG